MTYRCALLAVLFALLSAGCDLTAPETSRPDTEPPAEADPCPPGPGRMQADFFPLEVGNTWTYAYEHKLVARLDYVRENVYSGTVTFEITAASCEAGVRHVTFRKTTDLTQANIVYGVSTDTTLTAVAGTYTVDVIEEEDGLSTHPLFDGPWRRYCAVRGPGEGCGAGPSLIRDPTQSDEFLCYAALYYRPERGVGIRSMSYTCADPSAAIDERGRRTLIAFDPAGE